MNQVPVCTCPPISSEMFKTDHRQSAAASGILNADPGKCRIQIVAPVHEPGAGLYLPADLQCRRFIAGPDRRCETKSAVIHQSYCFTVGMHLHDTGDGAKDLFAHDRRLRRRIEQQLRREVRSTRHTPRKGALVNGRPSTGFDSRAQLLTDPLSRRGANYRTQRNRRIQRVTQSVLLDQLNAPGGEAVVDALMDVNALQATAGLAGIEIRTINNIFYRVSHVGIVPHINRIASAKLKPYSNKAFGGYPLHGVASGNGSGESDKVDAAITNYTLGIGMLHMQHLEDSSGQASGSKTFSKALCAQRRLRRVLE